MAEGHGVFNRGEILDSLDAVADFLAEAGAFQGVLVIVGGSYLALRGLRESTADVDTVTRIEASLRAAIEAVAAQRHLGPDWLNDHAAAFTPLGLTVEICEVLYQHTNLLVLGPPPDYIFLMKLYAARAPDYDDLVALWPSCTFASPQEAVDRFVVAYPHAPDDPDLAHFVTQVATEAAGRS